MRVFLSWLLTLCLLPLAASCGVAPTPAPSAFDQAALTADGEAVADALLAGDYQAVAARFDETMAAALDQAALGAGWENAAALLGAYEGRLSVEGSEKDGHFVVLVTEQFARQALILRVVYDTDGRIAGLQLSNGAAVSPQAQETELFIEEPITLAGDETMPLDGFLTLPKGVEKPPVVILVHGSGATDRDESIYGNKPFADIAHGLARRGIATLRYDKRHFVYPDNAAVLGSALTLRDEALDDLSAAIALMEADGRVDGSRVFVLGHSLGGLLLPAAGAEHPELAGLISMAGTLRPLWDVLYDQTLEQIAALETRELTPEEQQLLPEQIAQAQRDIDLLRGDFSAIPDDALLLGINAGYWRSLAQYGGMNFIHQLTTPMLILQGDADFQIFPQADYPLWQETLAGRDNVTFRLYSGLNHLMMPTQGKRDISEYAVPAHVAEEVLEDISAFVLATK